ncbi:MAG: hypothetical protein A4E29_01638 [Methanomassiliicoccales archaeon PtaB.Bin134]|nr:MAG: hypothetical protein A4E29_01638 [Methanomassiliicoccales archaeon PtaB.Bin134]
MIRAAPLSRAMRTASRVATRAGSDPLVGNRMRWFRV